MMSKENGENKSFSKKSRGVDILIDILNGGTKICQRNLELLW